MSSDTVIEQEFDKSEFQENVFDPELEEVIKDINENQRPKRVKIYYLEEDTWKDQGTGYCVGVIEDNCHAFLVVENEAKDNEILLRSQVEGDTQYQKQQDTLIVWTDSEGTEIALSFQESEGCTLVCEFLISVQRFFENKISLVAVLSNDDNGVTEIICGPIEYPANPTMNFEELCSILQILQSNCASVVGRAEISKYLNVNKSFFTNLTQVFEESEQQHNLPILHTLCSITKTLISYNENPIIDLLFNDENNFLSIIGILEYDPEYPQYKSKYREFLTNESKFKEIVPIEDEQMKKFIISTFNFQFLKDVVLARLLDDPTFNSITTSIYFNQVEIINYLQSNKNFLVNLFKLYQPDSNTDIETRRDGVKMLQQYILIAKSLQVNQRSDFYKSLIKSGLFKMIRFALKDSLVETRVLGSELIVSIIEHDTMLVNGLDSDFESESETEETDTDSDTFDGSVDHRLSQDEHDTDSEFIKKRKTNNNTAIQLSSPDKPKESKRRKSETSSLISKTARKLKANFTKSSKISKDMDLLLIITDLLVTETHQGLKRQAFEAIKALLDPSAVNINQPITSIESSLGMKSLKNKMNEYYTNFFKFVAPILFKPLIDLLNDSAAKHDNNLYVLLCELVTFCVSNFKISTKDFILRNKLIECITQLQDPDKFAKFTQLASIKCIKSIILMNDMHYTKNIITNKLLGKSLQSFHYHVHKGKINLVCSSVLDLLDIIINGQHDSVEKKNFKDLTHYLSSCYSTELKNMNDYCNSGKAIIDFSNKSELNGDNSSGFSRDNDNNEDEEKSLVTNDSDVSESSDIEMSVSPLVQESANMKSALHQKQVSKLQQKLSGNLTSSLITLSADKLEERVKVSKPHGSGTEGVDEGEGIVVDSSSVKIEDEKNTPQQIVGSEEDTPIVAEDEAQAVVVSKVAEDLSPAGDIECQNKENTNGIGTEVGEAVDNDSRTAMGDAEGSSNNDNKNASNGNENSNNKSISENGNETGNENNNNGKFDSSGSDDDEAGHMFDTIFNASFDLPKTGVLNEQDKQMDVKKMTLKEKFSKKLTGLKFREKK